jgi:hypothetical protein
MCSYTATPNTKEESSSPAVCNLKGIDPRHVAKPYVYASSPLKLSNLESTQYVQKRGSVPGERGQRRVDTGAGVTRYLSTKYPPNAHLLLF